MTLGHAPDMSINVERKLHDMRIRGRIVGVRNNPCNQYPGKNVWLTLR